MNQPIEILLFVDGKKSGRGTLRFGMSELLLEVGEIQTSLPSEAIRSGLGGTDDRYLLLSGIDGSDRRLVVYVDGRRHGELLATRLSGQVAEGIRGLLAVQRRRGRTAKVVMVLVLAFLFGIPLGLFLFRHQMAEKAVRAIPPSWEEAAGKATVQSLLGEYPELKDPQLQSFIEGIGERLLKAAGDQPYHFEFHLAKSDQINAFATPGGQVIVFTGLIQAAKSPEEVAGVLGHEIQHVLRRHSLKAMVTRLGFFAVAQMFFGDQGVLVDLVSGNAAQLMSLQFSRDEESEADRLGFDLLLKANIDPKGMVDFFRTLKDESPVGDLEVPALISTHPTTSGRIANLSARIEKLGPKSYEAVAGDWAAIQAKLGPRKLRAKANTKRAKKPADSGAKAPESK